MERITLSMDDLGGTVVDGGLDLLLAPTTAVERAEDAADLADIEQAEREAAQDNPYFA